MSGVNRNREPTSAPKPALDNGRPHAPHETRGIQSGNPPDERRFATEGREWIARVAGRGAYGTGQWGLGLIEAIHFFGADRPDVPVREALLAHGRFAFLHDDELITLLAGATPIVLPQG